MWAAKRRIIFGAGENLLKETQDEASNVVVLGRDGPVRAIHALGVHFHRAGLCRTQALTPRRPSSMLSKRNPP